MSQGAEAEAGRTWNRLLGPFWTGSTVGARLGLTDEEVQTRAQQMQLLGLRTAEGTSVFPSFQFVEDPDGQRWSLLPGLEDVMAPFQESTEAVRWTFASWMTAFHAELDRKSVIDYLKEGNDPAVVASLARSRAKAWQAS